MEGGGVRYGFEKGEQDALFAGFLEADEDGGAVDVFDCAAAEAFMADGVAEATEGPAGVEESFRGGGEDLAVDGCDDSDGRGRGCLGGEGGGEPAGWFRSYRSGRRDRRGPHRSRCAEAGCGMRGLGVVHHFGETVLVVGGAPGVGREELLENIVRRERGLDERVAAASAANDACLGKQMEDDLGAAFADAGRLRKRFGGEWGNAGQCGEHGTELIEARIAAGKEVCLDALVFEAIKEDGSGGVAIATSAAGLLGVGFQGVRKLVVEDEADVGLVDAEAEGFGGDDDPCSPRMKDCWVG